MNGHPPAAERDLVATQVNVLVREHLGQLLHETFQEVKGGVAGGVDWPVATIGFATCKKSPDYVLEFV